MSGYVGNVYFKPRESGCPFQDPGSAVVGVVLPSKTVRDLWTSGLGLSEKENVRSYERIKVFYISSSLYIDTLKVSFDNIFI